MRGTAASAPTGRRTGPGALRNDPEAQSIHVLRNGVAPIGVVRRSEGGDGRASRAVSLHILSQEPRVGSSVSIARDRGGLDSRTKEHESRWWIWRRRWQAVGEWRARPTGVLARRVESGSSIVRRAVRTQVHELDGTAVEIRTAVGCRSGWIGYQPGSKQAQQAQSMRVGRVGNANLSNSMKGAMYARYARYSDNEWNTVCDGGSDQWTLERRRRCSDA